MSEWIRPHPDGLPIGQVIYSTFELSDGSRATRASVVNGSYRVEGLALRLPFDPR